MRRAVVLVFLCLAVSACTRGGDHDGERIPDLPFDRFDGRASSLGDYEGTPLVINFFASWCLPCAQEMPDLEALHQEYGDEVVFLGLAVNDRADDAKGLVDSTGVTYDTGIDQKGEIVTTLGGAVMPTTVLVDDDGRIVQVISGKLDRSEFEDLLEDRLLPG